MFARTEKSLPLRPGRGAAQKLPMLADSQGRFADFQNRLAQWKTRYPTLRGFWLRVDNAKLLSSEPLPTPSLSESLEDDSF